MSGAARTLIDAVHAELLIDVQQLAGKVDELKVQIPAVTADIRSSAEGVKAAASKAQTDFEAMGHALVAVVRRQVEQERSASLKAATEAAKATKGALEQFTKFFWLLTALVGVNSLLTIVLLAKAL